LSRLFRFSNKLYKLCCKQFSSVFISQSLLCNMSRWLIPFFTNHLYLFFLLHSFSLTKYLACSNPCQTCSSSATTCTSCDTSGATPYLHMGTCLADCPSGFFASATNICTSFLNSSFILNQIACSSPCALCSGNAITCTGCDASGLTPYLYNNNCWNGCPLGSLATSSSSCQSSSKFLFYASPYN